MPPPPGNLPRSSAGNAHGPLKCSCCATSFHYGSICHSVLSSRVGGKRFRDVSLCFAVTAAGGPGQWETVARGQRLFAFKSFLFDISISFFWLVYACYIFKIHLLLLFSYLYGLEVPLINHILMNIYKLDSLSIYILSLNSLLIILATLACSIL